MDSSPDRADRADRPDIACTRLAARQHGLITFAQALECGMGTDAIFRRTKSGLWGRLLPRVLRVGEGTSQWHQRLSGLTKWSDGIASHRSAARLFTLDGFDEEALEITSERRAQPPWPGVIVHHASPLPPDSAMIDGIPCTSATRTLVDLAAVAEEDLVELAVEDALRKRLTSLPRLRWSLSVQGGRGRRGAKALRSVVQRLENDKVLTQSGFETRLRQALRNAGLPLPSPQFEIRHHGKLVARVDFAYPDVKLAIEAVSYRWHSGRSAWAHDQKRSNAIAALGWRVLNVTWDDLLNRPQEIVNRIAQALGLGSLLDWPS